MLQTAILWEEEVPLKQLPGFFNDEHTGPKKLPEVPCHCRRRANMARPPVLDVPGQCLEVRHGHVHVTRNILIDFFVGRLAGGHHFLRWWWRGGGREEGGREGVGGEFLCYVALSRFVSITYLKLPGTPAKNT
jgi:hypothetical protein